MTTEFRIVRQYTDDGAISHCKVQYKSWWRWKDVRHVISGGPDSFLSGITWFETIEAARSWVLDRRGLHESINEVLETYIVHG